MKKLLFFAAISTFLVGAVDAAAPAQRRGRTAGATSSTAASAEAKPVSARAATSARTAPAKAASATSGTGTAVRGRSGTTPTTGAAKPVAARAGTTQKVVGTGTKVAAAAKNVVVSEECQAKYEGCMDAFCMLDNETGGRCICSDKNAEFDSILAEIEKLDQQSYKMATVGVESLEMGDDAEAAMAMAKRAADAATAEEKVADAAAANEKKVRRTLDLSMWNTAVSFDEDEEDVFGGGAEVEDEIEGKEGDALYAAASKLCVAQIPECSKELTLLKSMYSQRVRSDCTAYENALKQQKNASAQKLAAAEQALRQTALDQYRSANKYDLGQCTVQFKKCMQTTGGCGEDFAACASVSATDMTNISKSTSDAPKTYKIQGASTTIEISASTYDTLMAKKPLCESVTKQCVKVADQVWDTFLREIAPTMKSAELLAEDMARQDCIGNIANCFQKGCKENIDPNDPDGSYDMCLTRPAAMLNVCKVPLNACGIDASSEEAANQSQIWEFVLARLASMRVDSCTKEVKACMQHEDRCGADYINCIGLDTDAIIEMCPYEKMVACQKQYGSEQIGGPDVYDQISQMIQGLVLNIDNSMYTACQNALNSAMAKVCGSSNEDGDCLVKVNETVASNSLEYYLYDEETMTKDGVPDMKYASVGMIPAEKLGAVYSSDLKRIEDTTNGAQDVLPEYKIDIKRHLPSFKYKIEGEIPWDQLAFSSSVIDNGDNKSGDFKYLVYKGNITLGDSVKEEIKGVDTIIGNMISSLLADEKLKSCIDGRTVQGLKTRTGAAREKSEARFPQLAESSKVVIADSVLRAVRSMYDKKYANLQKQGASDMAEIALKFEENDKLYQNHLNELFKQAQEAKKAELAAKLEEQVAKAQAEAEKQRKANSDLMALSCLQSVDRSLKEVSGYSREVSLNRETCSNVTTSQGYAKATFEPDTYTCTITKHVRYCDKTKFHNCECKNWGAWQDTTETINYAKSE